PRQALEQRARFSKPRTLSAAKIRGHRGLLGEHTLSPLASLARSLLIRQETRVVVLRLGQGRDLRHLRKQRARSLALADFPERMRKEPRCAVVVVLRVALDDLVEVGGGGRKVAEGDLGDPAAVERIGQVSAS